MAGLFLEVFSRRFLPFLSSFLSSFLLALEFLARHDGYFATRSLAGGCPIELNTDKIWLGTGETGSAKNRSKPAHRRTRPPKLPPSCG
ncbi:hypothetical protein [Bradyrhizobium sp. URHC0002]